MWPHILHKYSSGVEIGLYTEHPEYAESGWKGMHRERQKECNDNGTFGCCMQAAKN